MTAYTVQNSHCVVCGRHVRGEAEGVLFGGFGRPLFVACHAHVPLVRRGAQTLRRAVVAGVQSLVRRKLPNVWKFLETAKKAQELGS